ncbi:pyruvate dehydrogenase E2 component (dihydrolipoamide acetyltransferase) [Tranquillimonas rosea]|uniref:Acetyltransferase component of pyruvate dehydrogenase complex n=1 Tax=Tranquillimonas rosea TaxID=641238 RepID=A0A1H9V2N3_9RHOB|nr:pyruvate dehydrogenase E2 component (dihydrolipoamide acetyltransferase) [Tranquillimonas rosea]
MATEVKVPDIGDFTDVPVVTVLVSVGDTVAKEDPLVELESDKATMEVPSSAAGKVTEIKISEGDSVSEGSVILLLEEEEGGSDGGESGGSDDAAKAEDAPKKEEAPKQEAPKQEEPQPAASQSDAPVVTDSGFSKVHASPSVRAFARRLDVDLTKVNGSGRKGRILREDVTKYFKSQQGGAAAATGTAQGGMGIPPIPQVDFSKFGPVENVEMSRIKKISGPALHRSWLNIPHVTHNEDADITELDKYRKELDTQAKEEGYRVTLLSFIIKASVAALKKHWEVNSSIHPDGDKLIKKDYYHIGFAADTPNGLMVPVIKDADRKGIVELSKDLGDLSAKAREGTLKSADMQGASFTISSLGGIGGTSFTPIVNAPEVAILGLTRSAMKPVWDGEQFVPRNMLPMSLSYDHRAIDGALAARFCAHMKYLLADARRLML